MIHAITVPTYLILAEVWIAHYSDGDRGQQKARRRHPLARQERVVARRVVLPDASARCGGFRVNLPGAKPPGVQTVPAMGARKVGVRVPSAHEDVHGEEVRRMRQAKNRPRHGAALVGSSADTTPQCPCAFSTLCSRCECDTQEKNGRGLVRKVCRLRLQTPIAAISCSEFNRN